MAKQFRRSDRIDWHPFQLQTQAEERDQTELSDKSYRAVLKENPKYIIGGNNNSKQVDYPREPLGSPYDKS
jgi:hypothetical protein